MYNKISVVIPVYNSQKYLGECLTSLSKQTFTDFEVIIIDDGSTDDSPAIIERYCNSQKNFKVFRQNNSGLSVARNVGVEKSTGEFITFIDSDDYVAKNYLEVLVNKQATNNYDVVSGRFIEITEEGNIIGYQHNFYKPRSISKGMIELTFCHQVLGTFCSSVACSKLYRKRIITENDISFPEGVIHEDLFFTYKTLYYADKSCEVENHIYYYRQRMGSITKSANNKHADMLLFNWYDTQLFLEEQNAQKLYFDLATRRTLNFMMSLNKRFRSARPEEREYFLNEIKGNIGIYRDMLSNITDSPLKEIIPEKEVNGYRLFLEQFVSGLNYFESKKTVSIIVPCYNCQDYITYTLRSIERQTYKHFECIMIDDCSTDETLEMLRKYEKRDSRFRVIQHRMNSGSSAARNTGVRAATGYYICFLDSDDMMMPESLGVRIQALNSNSDERIAGSYCGTVTINEKDKYSPKVSANKNLKVVDYISINGLCPFNANQPFLKRSVFLSCGGFEETLAQAEDYDMWLRILRAGYVFIPALWNAVTYRQRRGSLIRQASLKHLKTSLSLAKSIYYPLPADFYKNSKPFTYNKPFQNYQYQLNVYKRIFEFVGMCLAEGGAQKELIDLIESEIPDIFNIINNDKEIIKLVKNGIARYKSGSYYSLQNRFKPLVNDFICFTKQKINASKDSSREETFNDSHFYIEKCVSDKYFIDKNVSIHKKADIVFLPHKDYHVWTVNLISNALMELGLSYIIVDISAHYRDEGLRSKAKELNLDVVPYSSFVFKGYCPKLLVTFNDWDPIIRSVFHAAYSAGIQTASIVEGIQDYYDVDTGRVREPYLCSDLVVLPGEFDKKYFLNSRQLVEVGGIPRLRALKEKEKFNEAIRAPKNRVLINSNFSYNVLVEKRDQWVRDSVEAAKMAGFSVVISRHPADLGTEYNEFETSRSFYDELENADVVIQRFASGILESLARGKIVVYFNPHGEKVDKFKEPMGAYHYIESKDELVEMLCNIDKIEFNHEAALRFLAIHSNINDNNMEQTIAGHLHNLCERKDRNEIDYTLFKNNLRIIDLASNCFSNLKLLVDAFKAIYGKNNLVKTDVLKSFNDLEKKFMATKSKVRLASETAKNGNWHQKPKQPKVDLAFIKTGGDYQRYAKINNYSIEYKCAYYVPS